MSCSVEFTVVVGTTMAVLDVIGGSGDLFVDDNVAVAIMPIDVKHGSAPGHDVEIRDETVPSFMSCRRCSLFERGDYSYMLLECGADEECLSNMSRLAPWALAVFRSHANVHY